MIKNGRIIKALSGFYYVDTKEEVIQCKARGKFRKDDIKPLVGDNVEIEIDGKNDGYILKIEERRNSLVRPPIANVDQAILIFSCKEPDFSSLLLDRFLAIIESKQITPVICISKMDLVNDDDPVHHEIDAYRKAGYTVHTFSSHDKVGLEAFTHLFKDKISVITGQSGVGKSSLLNALNEELELDTSEISKALGRGRHTTRHVELIPLFDGFVADTPGFSSLELTLSPIELAHAYHDFEEYSHECKFRGCLHDKEPGCKVKEALSEGLISDSRYQHYLMMLNETKQRKEKY